MLVEPIFATPSLPVWPEFSFVQLPSAVELITLFEEEVVPNVLPLLEDLIVFPSVCPTVTKPNSSFLYPKVDMVTRELEVGHTTDPAYSVVMGNAFPGDCKNVTAGGINNSVLKYFYSFIIAD